MLTLKLITEETERVIAGLEKKNFKGAREAIDNLVNPMSNTLNEYISKIKRCFKTCIIDDELADKYCITGKKTEPYKIALDPSLITLPRAVMDE